MIEETAGLGVERGDCRHILSAEFNIEHIEVLFDPCLPNGLRNCHDTALRQPAYNDLRHRFVVSLRDGTQQVVLENVVLAFGKRTPRIRSAPRCSARISGCRFADEMDGFQSG